MKIFALVSQQTSNIKKLWPVGLVWLAPVIVVILETLLFFRNVVWDRVGISYYFTFWGMRALLAPVIMYITFRFWVEYNKVVKLILLHIAGFLFFSVLFWVGSYLVLQNILRDNQLFGLELGSSNSRIFGLIMDNSASVNVMVYASTVVICYVWEYVQRSISSARQAAEMEKLLAVSRLELLKGQLNSHFLFNTLNTINSLVVRKQNDEANKMLLNLSELLRFALKENNHQLISLSKEFELLNVYMDIQKCRFGERLKFEVCANDDIRNAAVPSMILQGITENAVKHAVEPFSENGVIGVFVDKKDGMLEFSIKDNGKARFSDINFNKGIGLVNTRERLHKLFGDQQHFEIRPNTDEDGLTVYFRIPYSTTSE